MKQIAAMAIGARPLLIQLRDILEVPDKEERRVLRSKTWYRAGYVGSETTASLLDPEYDGFKDEQAIRVNAILSLYEDLPLQPIGKIVAEARRAYLEYDDARTWVGPNKTADSELWDELEKHFKPEVKPGEDPKVSPTPFQVLRNAYLAFLHPEKQSDPKRHEWRWDRDVLEAHLLFVADSGGASSRTQDPTKPLPPLRIEGLTLGSTGRNLVKEIGANARFALLEDPAVARGHARLLFLPSTPPEILDRFVARVTTIAHAFARAREARARLWRASLVYLSLVDRPENLEWRAADLVEVALKCAAELVDTDLLLLALSAASNGKPAPEVESLFLVAVPLKDALERARNGLILKTEPREPNPAAYAQAVQNYEAGLAAWRDTVDHVTWSHALSQALHDKRAAVASALLQVVRPLYSLARQNYETGMAAWRDAVDHGTWRHALSQALHDKRAAVASALLQVDEFFVERFGETNAQSEYQNLDHAVGLARSDADASYSGHFRRVSGSARVAALRRKYGLVRGPTDAGDTLLSEGREEFLAQLRKVLFLANLGLDRGRLSQGLTSLIDAYLQANYDRAKDPDADREKFAQLLDSLVGFAEKLRFIAGFQTLLGKDLNLREYVDVLQAVANSILAEADALRSKDRYQGELPRQGEIERIGLESARSHPAESGKVPREEAPTKQGEKGPSDADTTTTKVPTTGTKDSSNSPSSKKGYFTKLSAGLHADDAIARGDPRNVLDRLVAKLRYDLIDCVRRSGDDTLEAKNLRAALRVAMEQRSGMVFLRPASSYLRSSYPASSLQPDSPVSWKNMLDEHWKRSLFGGCGADEQALKSIQEIDKQFWQRVNQVRLGGAGSTNYVVAKDDVGNWYVKNYSADPKVIIDSMKSLAKFGAGGGFGADPVPLTPTELKGLSPNERKAAEAGQKKEADDAGLLEKQIKRLEEERRKKLAQTLRKHGSWVDTLRGELQQGQPGYLTAWLFSKGVAEADARWLFSRILDPNRELPPAPDPNAAESGGLDTALDTLRSFAINALARLTTEGVEGQIEGQIATGKRLFPTVQDVAAYVGDRPKSTEEEALTNPNEKQREDAKKSGDEAWAAWKAALSAKNRFLAPGGVLLADIRTRFRDVVDAQIQAVMDERLLIEAAHRNSLAALQTANSGDPR
ncbi:MAG: hypothetical protein HYZ53_04445 [Planctomycetes bacterium]|nr:hypothetical protein [Planctomycetota bacterium]